MQHGAVLEPLDLFRKKRVSEFRQLPSFRPKVNQTLTLLPHLDDSPLTAGVQELGITTPKSPGGKLWSPSDYNTYTGVSKRSSSPSSFEPDAGGSKPSSTRPARKARSPR